MSSILLVVPVALAALFWRLGALGPMVRCVIEHNMVPGAFAGAAGTLRVLSFFLSE